ncbi:hypothetical protein SRIMHP_26805 [Streptomyces rimosus subsp. rimosus]|uniref:Uncharacterized protein n=1 Tax=Streptomyces rimosus subsp. rimosus TaxID=132474 RepID=A0ABY3Z928_STRRM|nr:hypothetical protein SRIMR7_29430 [Streptomyces rimosus subsp. rimosus]UTH97734.1 hypothetical protein SRIMHP_26805 [Streptomyces rimosus subsp. rimosus]UTJ15832.1 hypothetical protein SRIMDV3_26705 [Streptomyces rimosus subsp. rimosus]
MWKQWKETKGKYLLPGQVGGFQGNTDQPMGDRAIGSGAFVDVGQPETVVRLSGVATHRLKDPIRIVLRNALSGRMRPVGRETVRRGHIPLRRDRLHKLLRQPVEAITHARIRAGRDGRATELVHLRQQLKGVRSR